MSDERVVIFIDGSNLYMGLRQEIPNGRIDMGRFAAKLCGPERQLVRTYYYYAPVDQFDDPELYRMQQPFLKALRNIPYFQLQLGKLERTPSGQYIEKGIDVYLATDMLKYAYKDIYDTAIIVTGDGDFTYVVREVKDLGKHVENASLRSSRSLMLSQTCDRFTTLDYAFFSDLLLTPYVSSTSPYENGDHAGDAMPSAEPLDEDSAESYRMTPNDEHQD
ncbi:MAG: NYN domain-containing protein [Chloroflexi bacterium]|nr:NYN domain-containing protein [Chloroflexota bacterium]